MQLITILLLKKKPEQDFYQLLTAYIGGDALPEPFDQRAFAKSKHPEELKQKSIDFWNTHALIEEK